MKTIIIPEATYDIPNWIYWFYDHTTISIILVIVGFVFISFLLQYLVRRRCWG